MRRLIFGGLALALSLTLPVGLASQRARVLKQIDVPHDYYYREMYLPQATSGPGAAAWSPDGRELVFSAQGFLWRQPLDSTVAAQLSDGPGYDYQPDWSPDGRFIVFSSYENDAIDLKVVETAIGRVGALACWEHYNPLARYALMAQHEEIHCAQYPGSLVGPIFAEQMEVTLRHHALESGCFVVNATAWLSDDQVASITPDPTLQKAMRGGCYTAIISPEGRHLCNPLKDGTGIAIADLDLALITKRKRMMDSVGHYARPELLSLQIDDRTTTPLHRYTAAERSTAAETVLDSPRSLHESRSRAVAGPDPDHGAAVARIASG